MPLLQIASAKVSNKYLSVAFCFLCEETQDYYKWALQNLLNIFTSNQIPLPEVVITDREQALINSLSEIFPNAYHMLCIWHIEKNLVTNGAKHIKNKLSEHNMIEQWNQVIQLSSSSDFRASFSRFSSQFGAEFQKYMESSGTQFQKNTQMLGQNKSLILATKKLPKENLVMLSLNLISLVQKILSLLSST